MGKLAMKTRFMLLVFIVLDPRAKRTGSYRISAVIYGILGRMLPKVMKNGSKDLFAFLHEVRGPKSKFGDKARFFSSPNYLKMNGRWYNRSKDFFGPNFLVDQNGRKLHEADFSRKIPKKIYKQFYFLPKIPKFQWEVVFPVTRFLRFSARS